MKKGQFVEWDSSGGTARGKIVSIVRNGAVPNIDANVTGTPEEPAARIQVYRKDSDGNYEATDTFVGHKLTELRGIKSLASLEELSPRQQYIVESYLNAVEMFGMFSRDTTSEGAHYIDANQNVFASEGLACKNCAFYAEDSGSCSIVVGQVEENAVCKLWVIENEYLGQSPEDTDDEEETDD